ncbi:MAG TPA: DUF1934 domain-containing protein [Clostridiales bacterium]|nr:DUF1934 domain-containing protein [Clostridiales bacterium]
MHEDVLVVVEGQQRDINDDIIIKRSKGSYCLKNTKEYIRYIENDENGNKTNVILKIEKDNIKIIKKGAIDTTMYFCVDEYIQVEYRTKLIDLLFEIYTYEIIIIRKNEGINVKIKYDLLANSKKISSNSININITNL